jgi:hypothetical protein
MGMPATALACSCGARQGYGEVRSTPDNRASTSAPWGSTDRARVFVGHVLAIDTTPGQPSRQNVRFVTEMSWRGELPDVVTLAVGADAPCAYYAVGRRYIVLADSSPVSKTTAVTGWCDYSWSLSGSPLLAALGPPNWTAPPLGSRSLDATAIALGTPLSRLLTSPDTLEFRAWKEVGMDRFEIGDLVLPASGRGFISVDLTPGLYQFRVRWRDGTTYESYVLLACDQRISENRCSTHRSSGLR